MLHFVRVGTSKGFAAAIVASLLLLIVAPIALAAIPGADDPKAYTTHDFLKGRVDFNKRTLTGAYVAVGKRDAKWDAAAIKFLDAMTIYFAYGPATLTYRTVEPATNDQLMTLIKATTDAGCDDPLVAYCHGVVLMDAGKADEAKPLIEKAAAGLSKQKYPAFRSGAAARRMLSFIDTRVDSPEARKYHKLTWDLALETIEDKVEDKDVRFILEALTPSFDGATPIHRTQLCKTGEESPTGNKWLVNLLYGKSEVQSAWLSRGSGWANSVTPEGWKGFYKHLQTARDYLTKAHQLRPDCPEAATEMMSVALGAGSELQENEREWFDRATRAQFDYAPAYQSYIYSQLPRWHGNHQLMFQFGLECLQTQRFDTEVPYQLINVVEQINTDSDGEWAVLKIPAVATAMRQLLSQSYEKTTNANLKAFYGSYEAAIDWKLEKYTEASALLDKVGANVDTDVFARIALWAPGAVSQVRLMTTGLAKKIRDAERDVEAGEFNAALLAYLDVSSKLPADHPGQLYLKHRARVVEIEKDFAAGKWVSLQPDENFNPWELYSGDWKVEKDGTLIAASAQGERSIMFCRARFGPDYEMEATMDFPGPGHKASGSIFIQWARSGAFRACGISAMTSSIFAGGTPKAFDQKVELKGGECLGVQVHDGAFTVLLNHKPIFENKPFNEQAPVPGAFVGIGGYAAAADQTVQFKNLRIRRYDPANK
jgi:hypothetical protein